MHCIRATLSVLLVLVYNPRFYFEVRICVSTLPPSRPPRQAKQGRQPRAEDPTSDISHIGHRRPGHCYTIHDRHTQANNISSDFYHIFSPLRRVVSCPRGGSGSDRHKGRQEGGRGENERKMVLYLWIYCTGFKLGGKEKGEGMVRSLTRSCVAKGERSIGNGRKG
jgi:hypothetical protein